MSAWGKNDQANNAPKWPNGDVVGNGANNSSGVHYATNTLFANTTVGAFLSNAAVGVYGVDTADMPSYSGKIANPGWVIAKRFTGSVTGFTVANAGATYANTDTVKVSNGTANATGTIVTNNTGGVVSVTLTAGGQGFINATAVNTTITTSTGTGANVQPILGGRAGRVQFETIAALGSITGNTYLP
jgi:hypothetical protein